MKKILIVIGVILIAIVIMAVLKDQVLKTAVEIASTQVTGARTSISKFSFNILSQTVTIKNLKIYNPPGFAQEVFLDMPLIHVDYVLSDILKQNLHFREIDISLRELVIIKDKNGKLNVDSLKVAEEKPKEGAGEKPQKQLPLQIDVLKLAIGKIVSKDYTAGDPPKIQVHDLGYKERTYRNITSAQQLVTLILTEALKSSAIKGAKIYGVGAILGVGFLPAGVAMTLAGKDNAQQGFDLPFEKVYRTSLEILKTIGTISSENQTSGIIKATIDKNTVTVKVSRVTEKSTNLEVSARYMLLPKPEAAGGVLRHISDKLK